MQIKSTMRNFFYFLNKILKKNILNYIIVDVGKFINGFEDFLNYLTKKSTFKLLEMLNNLSR